MIMSSHQSSVSKSHRSTNSVRVSNIAARVNMCEIIALFSTLIGEIHDSKEIKDCGGGVLEITFRTHDAAMKALCMAGYTVSGMPLNVSLVSAPGGNSNTKPQQDDRRNLYVLGLPFSLTKMELSNLFACYGTVTHCVILATLDNSSRRRGFVVMLTHREAKQAMVALTSTQLNGHLLDISWAVVQRSQGFLDGGDRLMALDPRPSSRINFRRSHCAYSSGNSSDSSNDGNELDCSSLVPSPTPTPTLLVSNLPTLLFSQLHDLHPLFVPFGQIKDLQVVRKSPIGSISVIVDYATAVAAKEAKESLTGQCYATFQVETCYLRSESSVSFSHQNTKLCGFKNHNVFAAPDNSIVPSRRSLESGLIGPYHNAKSWRYSNGLDPPLPKVLAKHPFKPYVQEPISLPRCSPSPRKVKFFLRSQ